PAAKSLGEAVVRKRKTWLIRHGKKGGPMTAPEREHLLQRLEESENARRRWKILALAGTPALALLLVLAAANAVSRSLALREVMKREQVEREGAVQAAEEARMEADMAREIAEQARRAAEEARLRAQNQP